MVPGCAKLEELTEGKKEEDSKDQEAKAADGGEAKAADGGEAKAADGGEVKVVDEVKKVAEMDAAPIVEPIPVEPLHTGLDLILTLVPEKSEFMIARDATVVADYVAEGTRFLDGPLATLKTGPFAGDRELRDIEEGFEETKLHTDKIQAALEGSGIDLAEGAAIVEGKGKDPLFIYHAADPNALIELGKKTGEDDLADLKCKAIESAPGFNVCAENQKQVDAYAPASDPAPQRTLLADNLPGVDLDEANLLAHINKGKDDEVFMAVTTIPGMVHMALQMPGNKDMLEVEEGMQPGPAKTLAHVQPGAGFVWAHLSPKLVGKAAADAKGTPGEAAAKSMTGEFVLAGSVDPGGLILQAGTTDTAGLEALLGMGYDLGKDQVPKEIPDVAGSTVVFEKVPIEGGGKTAQGLHFGVTGIPEADVLKSYTGMHFDAWAFAANDVFTLTIGPDQEHVGKLLDVAAGGPSAATLESLPKPLADGLGRNEVGMIVHMPMDFLHGAQMRSLAKSALKDLPDAPPDQILAMASLLAPLSSGTMWIAKPGGKPVIHVAVQAVGNRATEEGRAALEAAHTVADGGDPAVAFATLASAYEASPMAWAYKTRAGTDGPGYMIGSGLGAMLASAAVAVPIVVGARNEALAAELGVKPDDPEPELKPTTVPKQPTTKPVEPKKPDPVKDDPKPVEPTKPDPKKDDPKPVEPTKPDPKKDDPIVEPTKPLPPKPTPDPGKDEPKTRPTLKLGKGKGRRKK